MSNIADLIESYILQRLAAQQNRNIILKRADIANAIECAPSQISYVLNTRFTSDKGFVVESRRGLGGFIKIARLPLQDLVYSNLIDKIDENTTVDDLHHMLSYMLRNGMIENREAALLFQTFNNIYNKISPSDRASFLRKLIKIISHLPLLP
ncbi:CtsR family transcriptional regulator, partial [Pectinatus brassicae]|uniref:CtsR family transcriptional regulator n=1 Tax=Pectinatus brassicae TaxID=862415 RepID=UPI0018C77AFB